MMPELYLADALGAVGKPLLRVHTAGSVGGATGNVAASLVQAGLHRRVLAVAFEKQSESNAMWALSITPPFSMPVLAGAGGYFAPHIRAYIRRSGAPEHVGAVVAVKDRRNGSLNPFAHLRQPDITLEKVRASPMQPHAPLLADLAMYAYSVVPEKLVKAQGAAFFQHPVGSGPFMVTSFNPDSEVDLARNPYFYGIRPKISKVKILIIPNDNTRVLELESKKVDVIENPPSNLVSEINKTPNLHVQLFPSTRVDFIQLDQHFAPFKKEAVRQALNYAINRNTIVKLAYQGHAIAGSSFMPYRMEFWDNSIKPYPYDPAKAKQLLAQAGYPHGFTTFLITVSGDVAGQAEAVVVKQELAAVGVTVNIQSYELLTAYSKEDGGHSQMGERYWTNDIIDPDEVATFGADCQGGANAFSSYWCDTPTINAVNQARSELNSTTRQQLYDQVQQSVYTQSPFIVVDYSPYRYAEGDWVHGFHATPLGNYDLSLETLTISSH
jgi:peptide/nickel transport system substrate-binding protein